MRIVRVLSRGVGPALHFPPIQVHSSFRLRPSKYHFCPGPTQIVTSVTSRGSTSRPFLMLLISCPACASHSWGCWASRAMRKHKRMSWEANKRRCPRLTCVHGFRSYGRRSRRTTASRIESSHWHGRAEARRGRRNGHATQDSRTERSSQDHMASQIVRRRFVYLLTTETTIASARVGGDRINASFSSVWAGRFRRSLQSLISFGRRRVRG
jgi:hypothetical protein